jgi:hypothetical protein
LRDGNIHEVLDDPFNGNDCRGGAHPHRREPYGHGLRAFDYCDRHLFLQSHAAVAAGRAVNLNDTYVLFVGNFSAGDRGGATCDFYNVSGMCADAFQIGSSEPRNRASHILNPRFRNTQRHSSRERR